MWHSAKLEKNAAKTATSPVLLSATAWHSAKRSILPSARWYHSAKTIFKKIFLKKNCFFAECSALALGKHSNFAECQSLGTRQSRRQMLTAVIFLPSAGLALGKDFAECRFFALGKEIFADKIFAESTRQSLCRVLGWLCRVPPALDKEGVYSCECGWIPIPLSASVSLWKILAVASLFWR